MDDKSERWMFQTETFVRTWKTYRYYQNIWNGDFLHLWREGMRQRYMKLPKRYKMLADVRIERFENAWLAKP